VHNQANVRSRSRGPIHAISFDRRRGFFRQVLYSTVTSTLRANTTPTNAVILYENVYSSAKILYNPMPLYILVD